MTSLAFAVAVLGAPSISRSLRLLRVPSKAYPMMCVGSNGRSSRWLLMWATPVASPMIL